MKAVVHDTYGPPDVLRLDEVPTPEPGPGEVLVQVRAAGVDPGVWHVTTGRPYAVRLAFGLTRPRNRVRGMDVAGHVVALGTGVTRFAPGDEVFGVGSGTWAEYAVVPADRLVTMPATVGFEQAAATGVSGLTALQGLRDAGRVSAGQRVLVVGAGGGVGTFAVQLGVAFGAEVTAMTGPSTVDLVASLGATTVVDHTRHDLTAADPARYDVILDLAGHRPLRQLRSVLAPRGTLVLAGGEGGGAWLGGTGRQLRAATMDPFTEQRLRSLLSRPRPADLRELAARIAAGAVTPVVDRTYPLGDAAAALAHLRDGHPRGKLVLVV